uniref:RING-type domain-containing protein n=1 Tax=Chrysemys picta bellii TaxID=8478 RepID=A0A8C3FQM2_CHRPI
MAFPKAELSVSRTRAPSPSAPECHFSPTASPLSMSSRGMERLREDVTCSICLDVLDNPVSIECGHNFCRGCLMAHWHGVSAQVSQCPECRAPCSRDRMTPDTRLRALVEKITEPLREEMEPVRPDRPDKGKGRRLPLAQGRGLADSGGGNWAWGFHPEA